MRTFKVGWSWAGGLRAGSIVLGAAAFMTAGCEVVDGCDWKGTCLGACDDPSWRAHHPESCGLADAGFEAGRNVEASLAFSSDAGLRSDARADASTLPMHPDAAADVEAHDEPAPDVPSCDITRHPNDEPCLLSEAYGIFVAPTLTSQGDVDASDLADAGNASTGDGGLEKGAGGALLPGDASVAEQEPTSSDTIEQTLTVSAGEGTRAAPYRSLALALRDARVSHKNVYLCGGRYPENVVIDSSLDGLRMYGGFDCERWTYRPGSANPVVAPATGVPLIIKNLVAGATIEDIDWYAPPTTALGESSVAAFVAASVEVRLSRVKLVATDAQPGASAAPAPSNHGTPVFDDAGATTNYDGHAAEGANGGAAQQCERLCKNGEHSVGGSGGNGAQATSSARATSGRDGEPSFGATLLGGKGGAAQSDEQSSCSVGTRGANAPPAAGGEGAQLAGTLTVDGWQPSAGARGAAGKPGQGGGGGGGGLWTGTPRGGGGGGGCGGCGGTGGLGGKSGGSSFGLLSYQSAITLVSCDVTAGSGGNGGKGGEGQAGQTGGASGAPAAFGCNGGTGGTGATGGSGGGGAAGMSVAIGYSGLIPALGADTAIRVSSLVAIGGPAGTTPAGGLPATPGASGSVERTKQLSSP